jgi:hypothetical protein
MHAFDRWLGCRTLGLTAAAATATAGVIVLTDEAGSTTAMRLARLAALAPGLAALGAWLALSQASSRGELRALAALGANPWRVGLGASMAGWLIGMASTLVLCLQWVDAQALFPVVASSTTWLADGSAFIEPFAGVRMLPEGTFQILKAARSQTVGTGPGPFDALVAVGPLAATLPIWVTAPVTPWGRAATAALSATLLILLLHLVASGQASVRLLVLPAVPLAVQVVMAIRSATQPCSPSQSLQPSAAAGAPDSDIDSTLPSESGPRNL